MIGGSIILGFTLVGLAIYLHLQYGGVAELTDTRGHDADAMDLFERRRLMFRKWVHGLMLVSGLLMIASTAVDPGLAWAGMWVVAMGLLLIIIVLALFDALNSHRQHSERLSDVQRRMLTPVEDDDI